MLLGLRNRSNSLTGMDGQPRGSVVAWPDKRQRYITKFENPEKVYITNGLLSKTVSHVVFGTALLPIWLLLKYCCHTTVENVTDSTRHFSFSSVCTHLY